MLHSERRQEARFHLSVVGAGDGVNGQAQQMLSESKAGIHVEPDDPDALVEAINRLRNNDALRYELGSNGRRHVVEHLTQSRIAKAYREVLENLIMERKQLRRIGRERVEEPG